MGLKLWLLRAHFYLQWALVKTYRALRAPLTYWESRVEAQRAYSRQLLELQLQAQNGVVLSMAELMRETLAGVSASSKAQQELFKAWLDGFSVTEVPTSSVMREDDEIKLAMEREATYLRQRGIPVNITPQGTVDWLVDEMEPEVMLGLNGVDVDGLKKALQH